MKTLVPVQLAITVLGAGVVGFFTTSAAGFSFAAGAGVILFNFAVLVFGWPRVLAKKQVALGSVAIVIKFAILGWILYLATHSSTVRIGWFAFGMATVFPSLLMAAFSLQAEAVKTSETAGTVETAETAETTEAIQKSPATEEANGSTL
jgi:hypothetical protein